MSQTMTAKSHNWPSIAYFGVAALCFFFWAVGTSVQVLTSEAWMMGNTVGVISPFATFVQVWNFGHGQMEARMTVPFVYAWGVQLALIIASVGIELPKLPAWRYWGAWTLIIFMIAINSCGDWNFSASYGTWGQFAFTAVVLFLTFVSGLLAIMSAMHGFAKLKVA